MRIVVSCFIDCLVYRFKAFNDQCHNHLKVLKSGLFDAFQEQLPLPVALCILGKISGKQRVIGAVVSSPIDKCRFNGLCKYHLIHGITAQYFLDIVKILVAAVKLRKVYHRLEFFSNDRLQRISQNISLRQTVYKTRVSQPLGRWRYNIPEPNIQFQVSFITPLLPYKFSIFSQFSFFLHIPSEGRGRVFCV